jgi:hypothetical protein
MLKQETLEKLEEELERAKDKSGTKLYSHMSEILNQLILTSNKKPLTNLEQISHLVKQSHLDIKDPLDSEELKQQEKKPCKVNALLKDFRSLLNEVSITIMLARE